MASVAQAWMNWEVHRQNKINSNNTD
jgi:hypothetical protein